MSLGLRKMKLAMLGATVLAAMACEEVVPYPDTGAEEMMLLEGVADEGTSEFSVRRIFPISEKNFVARKDMIVLDAVMNLTVNGKEIVVTCTNDSLSCVFSTDYKFQAKDKICVNVSAQGVPDVRCETTVPDVPEVMDMSYGFTDDDMLTFSAMVQTCPQRMDGYVYFLEMETEKMEYVDGTLKSKTIGINVHNLPRTVLGWKTINYNNHPVMGYEDADDNGIHHLNTEVELFGSLEIPDAEGHIVRTDRRVNRIRFCAWHLSTALYLSLKTAKNNKDYSQDSQISFVTPLEYSNVTGGKGAVGAVSVYRSEWRDL
mgnify:CR=1 FL=1